MKQSLLIFTSVLAVLSACVVVEGASRIVEDDVADSAGDDNREFLRPTSQYERIETEGTSCSSNDEASSCSPDEYCHREVGSCNGSGVCKTRPYVCTMDWTPVCGVDGKIYGNRCGADANGVCIAYEGECGSRNNQGSWLSFVNFNPAPVETTPRPTETSAGRYSELSDAIICGLVLSFLIFGW